MWDAPCLVKGSSLWFDSIYVCVCECFDACSCQFNVLSEMFPTAAGLGDQPRWALDGPFQHSYVWKKATARAHVCTAYTDAHGRILNTVPSVRLDWVVWYRASCPSLADMIKTTERKICLDCMFLLLAGFLSCRADDWRFLFSQNAHDSLPPFSLHLWAGHTKIATW